MLFYPSHLPHHQLQEDIDDGDNYSDKEREESDLIIIGLLLRLIFQRSGNSQL